MIGEDEIRVCHCHIANNRIRNCLQVMLSLAVAGFAPQIAEAIYKTTVRDTRENKRCKDWRTQYS